MQPITAAYRPARSWAASFWAVSLSCLICLASLSLPGRVEGSSDNPSKAKVLMVLSRRSEPYTGFERVLRDEFDRAGLAMSDVTTVVVGEGKGAGSPQGNGGLASVRSGSFSVVVAIGTRAAMAAADRGLLPLVAVFVVEDSAQVLVGRYDKGIVAIPMEVPLSKRLSLLAQIVPGGRVVLFVDTPQASIGNVEGLEVSALDASSGDLVTILDGLEEQQVDALVLTPNNRIFRSPEQVRYTILWGIRTRTAIVGLSSGYVRNGALLAVEPDYGEIAARAAALASKLAVEPGQTAFQSRIEPPDSAKVSINLKTARRIGVTIPWNIVRDAWLVIE